MNYKRGIALLLLAISVGCQAGVKKRLKKFLSCVFASQAVTEPDNSSDIDFSDKDSSNNDSSNDSSGRGEFVYPPERAGGSRSSWNSELFRKTGILPEDIRKNPAHPDKAAYERRILEAME